jgi:hypothetical protein
MKVPSRTRKHFTSRGATETVLKTLTRDSAGEGVLAVKKLPVMPVILSASSYSGSHSRYLEVILRLS